jgi:hypothetical protein
MEQKKETDQLKAHSFTPIEGTTDYAYCDNGYVYNLKTGKRLLRRWTGRHYRSTIRDADGRSRSFCHRSEATIAAPDPNIGEFFIPTDFPDYGITPHGAIWRLKGRGGRLGRPPYLLAEQLVGDQPYVKLVDSRGVQRQVRVKTLLDRCWAGPNGQ